MVNRSDKISIYIRYVEVILLVSFLLYAGKTLFIPLSFAWLLSIILYPVCKWFEKRGFISGAAIVASLLLVCILVAGLSFIIGWQLLAFKKELPSLLNKLAQILNDVQQYALLRFHISLEQQVAWFQNALLNLSNNAGAFLKGTVDATVGFLYFIVMVPLFAALILYYRQLLVKSLYALLPAASHALLFSVLQKTIAVYYNYVKGLLIIYLVVAILNSVGLYFIGIEHAILYGTLASLLTIIPYIGITVGSLLPITIAWITYDSFWYPLGVVSLFVFVQYLEANIIFPWVIGQRLKVNTLASLVALIIGGILWGASGMVLFLPFVAILKIVAENIPAWKALDILLGTDEPVTTPEPGIRYKKKIKSAQPFTDRHSVE
jgi:predicted PurR-regulated permease PerM